MDEITAILRAKRLAIFDPGAMLESSKELTLDFAAKSQALFNKLTKQLEGPVRANVNFRLTTHLGIDAFATQLQKPNEYLVGMGYGVVSNLYACFAGLLSHPEILPFIGDSKNTVCKFTRVDFGLLDFTYENQAIRDHASLDRGFPMYNYPIDEDRIQYVILLTDIATQFILYHEWGHIIEGHVDYLSAQYGINEILEMDEALPPDSKINLLAGQNLRRSMEFNADYVASCMAARLPLRLKQTGSTDLYQYPRDFLDRYDLRDAVVFSLFCLFHLFHELRIKKGLTKSEIYPSPYLRFISLFAGMFVNPITDTSGIWDDYEYEAPKDFTRVSQLLQFELLFADEMFDREAIAVSYNLLLNQISALSVQLRAFRMS